MTQTNSQTQESKNSVSMGNNSTNQSQHSVIPTERSDDGSLTSARDDKRKTNMSYADTLRETQQEEFPLLSEVAQGLNERPNR